MNASPQQKKPVWAYLAACALLVVLTMIQTYYLSTPSAQLDSEQAAHQESH